MHGAVRRRQRLLLATAVVLGAITALVTWQRAALTDLDVAVGGVLVFHGDGPAITALQVLTAPGAEDIRYPLLMPVAGFALWFRRWRLAAFLAVPTLIVSPLNRLLKGLFERPRPSYAGTTVTAGDWSFPSGHASGAAVLAGVLLVILLPHIRPRWRPPLAGAAVLGAIVVAWTRLALGVHYLSDVVAGLAFGAVVVLGTALALRIRPPG